MGAARKMPCTGCEGIRGKRLVIEIQPVSTAPWILASFDSKPANQQTGRMKTTFELPGDLVREVKLRALRDGRKLKDTMADLLRRGLKAGPAKSATARRVKVPLVQCRRAAVLSPDQVAGVLLKQEAVWHHEAS